MSAGEPGNPVDPRTGEDRLPPPSLDCTPDELERAFAQIVGFEQRIFVLHRFDGLSFEQIAEQEGISVRRVEKALTKALTTLRRALRQMGKFY